MPALRPYVLVVDDDRIYPTTLIADLEKAAANHPGAALGLGGWIAPPDLIDRPTSVVSNLLMRPPAPIRSARIRKPVAVDILQGVAGYLVRPEFFDLAAVTNYERAPPAARTSAATASSRSRPRAESTSLAPCRAKRRAAARPMPELAPVMMATLLSRRDMGFSLDGFCGAWCRRSPGWEPPDSLA